MWNQHFPQLYILQHFFKNVEKKSPDSFIVLSFYEGKICAKVLERFRLFEDTGAEEKAIWVCITKITTLGNRSSILPDLLICVQMLAIILYLKDGKWEHFIHLFSPRLPPPPNLKVSPTVRNPHTSEPHLRAAWVTLREKFTGR